MMMPPPSKKHRRNATVPTVDLSYVSPSQGTVFLASEEVEQQQQQQRSSIHDSATSVHGGGEFSSNHSHDATQYNHSPLYTRIVSPDTTLSSTFSEDDSNKHNKNGSSRNIHITGTGTDSNEHRETAEPQGGLQSQQYHHQDEYHGDSNVGGNVTCQQTIAAEHFHHDEHSNSTDEAAMSRPNSVSTGTKSATTGDTSSASTSIVTTISTTRFDDIIGHGDVKVRMDELLLPLALPPSWTDSLLRGVRALPASLLLYGPPGCGKTQLAHALAGESQAAFLSIRPSDVLSKFVGESERAVKSIFVQAQQLARGVDSQCAVLFLDEVDALGYARGGASEGDGSRRILAELLIQMSNLTSQEQQQSSNASDTRSDDDDDEDDNRDVEDRAQSSNNNSRVRVLVVAATNRLADCDPALVRRFAIQIHVGLPTERDRRKIFKKYLNGNDANTDNINNTSIAHTLTKRTLRDLAQMTEGWSGSDLESLTREAAMAPIRECLQLAASTKRKLRKSEQHQQQKGGNQQTVAESSRQEGGESAQVVARNVLWKEFQRLRPVTMADFETALAFLLNASSTEEGEPVYGRGTYDDSSSSESEDDNEEQVD